MRCFVAAVAGTAAPPISFESLWATTLATFRIRESLHSGGPRKVAMPGDESWDDRVPVLKID